MVSRRRLEVNTENRSRGAPWRPSLTLYTRRRTRFGESNRWWWPASLAIALYAVARVSLRSPRATKERKKKRMRNAVRRRPIHRNLRCGAHPAGRARLPAFHRGSSLGTHASRGATPDQVSRRWRLGWRGSPAGAGPGCSEHLACRS